MYISLVKEGVVIRNKRFKKFLKNACTGHILILLLSVFSIGLFLYLSVFTLLCPKCICV